MVDPAILVVGYKTKVAGIAILVGDYREKVAGIAILVGGYREKVAGIAILVGGYRLIGINNDRPRKRPTADLPQY